MKFQTHNDKEIATDGTYLFGDINARYSDLVELLGEPFGSDGYKSDAEWEIEFEDGVVATIYNWKNGKNYCGANGLNVEDITNWHIGAKSRQAIENIDKLLGQKALPDTLN